VRAARIPGTKRASITEVCPARRRPGRDQPTAARPEWFEVAEAVEHLSSIVNGTIKHVPLEFRVS